MLMQSMDLVAPTSVSPPQFWK